MPIKKRESFVAQAEKAKAKESVKTGGEVEKAECNKPLLMIAAEREAQERSHNIVEIDAFVLYQAEIAPEAAGLKAGVIRTLAAVNRDRVDNVSLWLHLCLKTARAKIQFLDVEDVILQRFYNSLKIKILTSF